MTRIFNTSKSVRPTLGGLAFVAGLLVAAPGWSQVNLRVESDFSVAARAQALQEPPGLRAAADAGFRKMLVELGRDIPEGSLPDNFPFDVNDFADLKAAKLGLAFEVYTVHPQNLLKAAKPFEQMLQGNGIWNFVVLHEEHPVALLEMAKVNGKWEVMGAGGAKLAQDIQQAAQTHTGKKPFRFVRIYQATADLLEVQDAQAQARYVPLIAARQSLRMISPANKESVLASGQDLLPSMQEAVRSNLAAHTNP